MLEQPAPARAATDATAAARMVFLTKHLRESRTCKGLAGMTRTRRRTRPSARHLEGVARADGALAKAAREPVRPLTRRAVRPALRIHASAGCARQAVVAHGRRG